MKQRLEPKGMAFESRQVPGGDLWQIFVNDPNGVMIELNYEAAKEAGLSAPPMRAGRRRSQVAFCAEPLYRSHRTDGRFERDASDWLRGGSVASRARVNQESRAWFSRERNGFRRYASERDAAAGSRCLGQGGVAARRALTNANVLSEITVNDGKVFFSINVDAAEARAWESVRAQAEAAVRAIPGVTVGDDRADGRTQAGQRAAAPHAAPAPHRARPCPRRAAGVRAPAAARPGRRRWRSRRRSRALPPSSRWPRARAASANRPPRSIWRWACAISACGSACSMPIFTAPRCRG